LDMMMVCHHLNPGIPEEVAFAESRIRGETIAAEDVLHDIGAQSMYSSDSQAMGRVGEVTTRAWQTADKMKKMSGRLKEEKGENDNLRAKRYLAKLTINPRLRMVSQTMSVHCSRKDGRHCYLDIFRCRTQINYQRSLYIIFIDGGPQRFYSYPEPVHYRPMFGASGRAKYSTSVTFTSKLAIKDGLAKKLGLKKKLSPVKDCRTIGKKDMILNNLTPQINIDAETYIVEVNGKVATTEPACKLSLSRLYNLF
jgi:urease subunit alpha